MRTFSRAKCFPVNKSLYDPHRVSDIINKSNMFFKMEPQIKSIKTAKRNKILAII